MSSTSDDELEIAIVSIHFKSKKDIERETTKRDSVYFSTVSFFPPTFEYNSTLVWSFDDRAVIFDSHLLFVQHMTSFSKVIMAYLFAV